MKPVEISLPFFFLAHVDGRSWYPLFSLFFCGKILLRSREMTLTLVKVKFFRALPAIFFSCIKSLAILNELHSSFATGISSSSLTMHSKVSLFHYCKHYWNSQWLPPAKISTYCNVFVDYSSFGSLRYDCILHADWRKHSWFTSRQSVLVRLLRLP